MSINVTPETLAKFAELALDAGKVIAGIVSAVQHAGEGKVTPEQARRQIGLLTAGLADNDAAADAALDRKFAEEDGSSSPALGSEPDPLK